MKIPKVKAKKITKKGFIVIAIIEVILAFLLLGIFLDSVSINHHDTIHFEDPQKADDISCKEGVLAINNVRAEVPVTRDPSYNISYSWADTDTEYPTVPKAAIASYQAEDGTVIYELSLYKDSFRENARIQTGKSAATWFNDWATKNDNDKGIKQGKLDTSQVHGFYISTLDSNTNDSEDVFLYYTYYFSVPDVDGVYVYVLEGILRNPDYKDELKTAISNSINKITIVNPDDLEDEDSEDEDSIEEGMSLQT